MRTTTVLGVAVALIGAAACDGPPTNGSNDDVDDTGGESAPAPDIPHVDRLPLECPDHPAILERWNVCVLSAPPSSPIVDDLTLDAGHAWLLDGPVVVGNEDAFATLTVLPGTRVYGGDLGHLVVRRGSRLVADGAKEAPIVFTSAQVEPQPGDWPGIEIHGRAPINHPYEADGTAVTGWGRYGGADANDSSGVLRFVRIEFVGVSYDAGGPPSPGLRLLGVGRGTVIDSVQVHLATGDGVEVAGGTVDMRRIVATGADDDGLDWSGGWNGRLQYMLVRQRDDSGPDAERGIEGDNLEADNEAFPFSNPILSNVTLIGRGESLSSAIRLRRGTRGELWNLIATRFSKTCLRVSEAKTEEHVDDGSLLVQNHVYDCADGPAFEGAAQRLIANANVVAADPQLDSSGVPASESAALNIGEGPMDRFFDPVAYAGALHPSFVWTEGWTVGIAD